MNRRGSEILFFDDLPPNIEVAMILVASCPGGSLSNVVTHFGRGNTALSVSISAAASLIALVATPFNFSWMVASNPNTASWLKVLAIDPSDIWISLVLLLALPMSLGLINRDTDTKKQSISMWTMLR